MIKKEIFRCILSRLASNTVFIQLLIGPRHIGKTTLARQIVEQFEGTAHFASADEPTLKDGVWIRQQWELAQFKAQQTKQKTALLVLDEIQKISQWSETVKALWDKEQINETSIKVLLLGSAPLRLQKGLTESLAGRFELIPMGHWSYKEMKLAFGWDINQYIYFGGYPGAASLVTDEDRWRHYICDALIETTVSRDILLLNRVDKPALLRRLFFLACEYASQILSYQKIVGQLQDAGNTTTLAHYLRLLDASGMAAGISKFANHAHRQRASSPKLQVYNTALISASLPYSFEQAQKNRDHWGRLVESAVGAYLLNSAYTERFSLYYWREKNREVDFVIKYRDQLIAIEVKSGRNKGSLPGLASFSKQFDPKRIILVGGDGIALEEFFLTPVVDWFL